jgi:hypothetical protein
MAGTPHVANARSIVAANSSALTYPSPVTTQYVTGSVFQRWSASGLAGNEGVGVAVGVAVAVEVGVGVGVGVAVAVCVAVGVNVAVGVAFAPKGLAHPAAMMASSTRVVAATP